MVSPQREDGTFETAMSEAEFLKPVGRRQKDSGSFRGLIAQLGAGGRVTKRGGEDWSPSPPRDSLKA